MEMQKCEHIISNNTGKCMLCGFDYDKHNGLTSSVQVTLKNIQDSIKNQSLPLSNEKELQLKLEKLFNSKKLEFKREVRLDSSNIIDFQFGGVGVEVKIKTKASVMSIYRQIKRYCDFDTIEAIVILSGRAISMPSDINGKPIYVISLSRTQL